MYTATHAILLLWWLTLFTLSTLSVVVFEFEHKLRELTHILTESSSSVA